MNHRLLRRPEVELQCGIGRSSLYHRMSQGLWPKPIALGPRSVAWPESEVIALNAARISGMTDDEVRDLVKQLEKDRLKVFKNLSKQT